MLATSMVKDFCHNQCSCFAGGRCVSGVEDVRACAVTEFAQWIEQLCIRDSERIMEIYHRARYD